MNPLDHRAETKERIKQAIATAIFAPLFLLGYVIARACGLKVEDE